MTTALSFSILAILLVAGLRPFGAPLNQVSWLRGEDGLRFGDFGVILTREPLLPPDAAAFRQSSSGQPCSIELWLRPQLAHDENTILSFSSAENPVEFALRQQDADLEIWRHGSNGGKPAYAYRDQLFAPGGPIFIAVTASANGTSLYVNGELDRAYPRLPVSLGNLRGQLIFAGSPVENDAWSGTVKGLAIYAAALTAEQVRQHYAEWNRSGALPVGAAEHALALYRFDERAGNVAHNLAGSTGDLIIPKKFMLLRPTFLDLPWRAFRASWGYAKDVALNVCGFVPFGFVMCMYFTVAARRRNPAMAAVIAGVVVSFTIECLQVYLPTRHSDLTDALTNTLGTCAGVGLYHLSPVRTLVYTVFAWASRSARGKDLALRVN